MLISSSYFFVLPSFFLFFFLPFLLPSFFLLFFAFVKLLYSVFLLIFYVYWFRFLFFSFLSLSPFRYYASLSPSFPFFSSNSLHPHSIAARRKIGLGFGKWVWKNVGAPLFTIDHGGHCIDRRHSYFFLFVVTVLTPINKITPNFLFQET